MDSPASAPLASAKDDRNERYLSELKRFNAGEDREDELKRAAFDYLHRANGSPRLVVVFSTTQSFTLQKYKFNADALFLTDVSGTYYCLPSEAIAELVQSLVRKFGYREVTFFGCSKGGSGAISAAIATRSLRKKVKIHVVAFSPQTQIYPHHPNADSFPSYKNLATRLEKLPRVIPIVARSANLVAMDFGKLDSCRVIYGERNAVDSFEVARLRHCRNVQIVPLPTAQHYTLGFYTIPADVDIERARAKFAEIDDPDVVAMRTDDAIEEYLALSKRCGLNLASLLIVGPSRFP